MSSAADCRGRSLRRTVYSASLIVGQSQGDKDAINRLIIDLSQWMRSGDASAIELSMEPRVLLTTYDGGVVNGPKSVASYLSGGFLADPKDRAEKPSGISPRKRSEQAAT
jgi:hypothetical protein